MEKYFDILKKSFLFNDIDEKDIEGMMQCLGQKTKSFNKNSYIVRIGDEVKNIGILAQGGLYIVKEDFWGNRNIISEITAGDVFAESYACSPGVKSGVDVIAKKDSTVIFLDSRRILTTCGNSCVFHSRLIRNLMYVIAKKNILMTEKLSHITKRTTREKLLSFLSAQSVKNSSGEFDIQFNRQQLADYLSVDRSAMSAELCKMRDEGLIAFNKNHFKLFAAVDD